MLFITNQLSSFQKPIIHKIVNAAALSGPSENKSFPNVRNARPDRARISRLARRSWQGFWKSHRRRYGVARSHLDLQMPSRLEPGGRASLFLSLPGESFRLLPVVHRGAADLLALRISSARGDRTAFVVSRHNNATGNGGLAAFLDVEPQRMVVDLREGPRV